MVQGISGIMKIRNRGLLFKLFMLCAVDKMNSGRDRFSNCWSTGSYTQMFHFI